MAAVERGLQYYCNRLWMRGTVRQRKHLRANHRAMFWTDNDDDHWRRNNHNDYMQSERLLLPVQAHDHYDDQHDHDRMQHKLPIQMERFVLGEHSRL